jgi:hypothetical protein
MTRVLPTLALLTFLAACAGTPGPGDQGYAYNLVGEYSGQFSVQGQGLPATMQLDSAPGGTIVGTFAISMMGIEGTIEGEIVGDTVTYLASYYNPDSGCDGVASAQGTISQGGASMEGQVEVTECGNYLTGSFSFSK